MKANIKAVGKHTRKVIAEEADKYIAAQVDKIQQETARRTMKMFCVALYDAFDFDSDKCRTVLKEFIKMSDERKDCEETFWWTIDKICMGELNLSDLLEKENYEVMDK